MADLSYQEKQKFEKLLEMSGGYVLDFVNRTFEEFVFDSIGINIYDEKYRYDSCSKANLLRGLWIKSPNYMVGKLLGDLVEHWKFLNGNDFDNLDREKIDLYFDCKEISNRLVEGSSIDFIDDLLDTGDFEKLSRAIKDSIQRDEPEVVLDRLHTYTMKYVRSLCDKHGISYNQSMALNGLFGRYVKHIEENQLLDSQMSLRILKATISIFDSFNNVRNNQSLAHDNPILNHEESVLIFNNVLSTLRFLHNLEKRPPEEDNTIPDWDIPF